jgi:hypothetical protein
MLAQHIRAARAWCQFGGIFTLVVAWPAQAMASVCSVTEPVCVELGADAPAALADAERAVATLRVLGLPPPRTSLERGVLTLPAITGSACEREAGIVRAVVASSMKRAEAEPITTAALTEVFANLASPCRLASVRSDDATAARAPERGWPLQGPRFLEWLDTKVGAAGPGRYLAGVTTRLPYRDVFAVLRENTKDAFYTGSTFGDAVAAFGLERFYPKFAQYVPPPQWDVEWPVAPRALSLPQPLAPLGSAAIRIRVAEGQTASAPLRIEAAWEQHAEMRIAVLAVDGANAVLQKAWIPTRARIPEAQFTFGDVPGARAIVLVITSLGDPFVALTADQISFEPHGAVVTLAEAR